MTNKDVVVKQKTEPKKKKRRKISRKRLKRFLEVLYETKGNVAAACRIVKIDRSNVYRWLLKDLWFKEKFDEVMEAIKDDVESALQQRIEEGDTYAIVFYLKTKCKDRGYTEKIETLYEGNVKIQVLPPPDIDSPVNRDQIEPPEEDK